jgi:hypothetical protein
LGNVKLACNRKSHMSWQTCGAGSVPHLQLPCNLTPDSLLLCHPHSPRGTCYSLAFLCCLALSAVRLIMQTSPGILDSDLVAPELVTSNVLA